MGENEKKGIIEKLGINRESFEPILMRRAEDSMVSRTAPEMLEALIHIVKIFNDIVPENTKYKKEYYDQFLKDYDMQIKAIENATNKTWEEIKQIIKE